MSIQPLDFTVVSKAAPPIPSKWDVIPVHGSDRGTFKFCRRQWAWSSPSKYNLIPRAAVHGIREPLWFGTGFHHALERYYAPHLNEDPVVTWQAWFDLQWNGGLVHINDIKEFIDREPIQIDDTTFKVKGLDELLPFPDPERFAELRDLGTGMAQFYKSYAEKNDAFNVIETEHDFSVPIFTPDGDVFYAEDTRETPDDWEPNFELENEFGPLMKYGTSGIWKQVHARGRQDLIIQDSEVGQFGMFDHKTTSRTDDDYFRGLDLDEQCTTYLAIGELEARMYGLEYEELDFIIYQAILKGYPKPPTITSRGMPSINRQEETTTAEMFEATIKGMGLTAIFEADPKLQNYYTWLLEKGDERFIVRTPVLRNKAQKRNALLRLYYEAVDMLSNPRLYPNPTRNYGCLNCVFRGPCIMREAGDDWEATIADGYVQNFDR